ncbi:hypothetical protein F5X98DRAFT_352738 [Xylaria grammica]|nr:hypothetical protein F5X98DRAFT_352738 [Xylaria grammica]
MGRDSDTSASAAQSRRPPYNRRDTGNGSDSQVSQVSGSHHHHQQNQQNQQNPYQQYKQHQQQQLLQQQQQQQQQSQHRPKHQKHVVGGGAGRFHARVPSSKGLHKNHSQSAAKLKSRASSPEPEHPPLFAHTHRRTTSDLKLTAIALDSPATSNPNSNANSHVNLNLKKNSSQSNLISKPSRPRPDIGKRSKSAAYIKRSSSHKDVQKLKGPKNQVHFDLGNDETEEVNDDEWVDASASASPYLSRRGSVVSGGQSPAKPPSPTSNGSRPHTPQVADDHLSDHHHNESSPTRQTARHNKYITSRLLQRTPSHGAPPQMSTETVSVPPGGPSGSPASQASHGPPSLYGTPKASTLGASGPEELISRFVNGSGPSSGGRGDPDSYFVAQHAPVHRNEGGVRRPQSLSNLNHASRDSASEEDESTLVPRSRKPIHRAPPASQSRTQQKLNLQRASSSIEPAQAGPGVGVVGPSLLVGSTDYEHRDPRIARLLERTGMEYLVVRRYQNPIARSIARLSHLPGANKNRRIPKQNGTNGTANGKNSLDLDGTGRLGLSQSLTHLARSRPTTPRRSTSIRTMGARSSYDGNDDRPHDRMSGSGDVNGNDDNLSALLRNLWDKSNDLGAGQD